MPRAGAPALVLLVSLCVSLSKISSSTRSPERGKPAAKIRGLPPHFQISKEVFSGPSPEKGENRSNIAASVPESGCKSTRLRETGKTNGGLFSGNGQNKWGTFLKKFPDARRRRLQYSGLKKRQGRRKGRGRGREDTLLYNIRGKGPAQADRETSARKRQDRGRETGTPLTQRGRT